MPVPSNRPTNTQSAARQAFSKGCGTLFFSVFLMMGCIALFAIGWAAVQSIRPYLWKETPCTIVESHRNTVGLEKAANSDKPFVIRYRYNFGGSDYTSDRRSMGMEESLNESGIEKLLVRYQQGARTVCYVNSTRPEQAVLRRGPIWPMVFIFMPMIFIAVGVGGIMGTWSKKPFGAKPFSRRTGSKTIGTVAKLALFGFLALVGGILTYVISVKEVVHYIAAKQWPEVPCEILRSNVDRHSGSKGSTYSIDILYRYQIGDRSYQSDTYALMAGSSSGYDGKAAVVNQYRPGSRAICFVNPTDPTDALLNRDLSWWLLLGLIPAVFLLVGVFGLISTARSALGSSGSLSQPMLPGAPGIPSVALPPQSIGPEELRSTASPLAKFGAAVGIAIFWNGITGVFAGLAVKSWIDHKPEWFLTIFLTPFVLIGLLLIGIVGSSFLGLFNPRLRLTVNSRAIPLGGSLDVSWAFRGAASRIKRFKLILEGREEATYRRGTNTSTDRNVFASLVLMETSDSRQIAQGQARVEIPGNLMHSWAASHNKIVWILKAKGDIPRYPDVHEEFEFTVLARTLR